MEGDERGIHKDVCKERESQRPIRRYNSGVVRRVGAGEGEMALLRPHGSLLSASLPGRRLTKEAAPLGFTACGWRFMRTCRAFWPIASERISTAVAGRT